MSDYKATTTFTYKTTGSYSFGERSPQKVIKVETQCEDLNSHEMLDLFKDFMVGCGYLEKSFYDACKQATEENPYAKGGDGYELEKSNEDKTAKETSDKVWNWHSGGHTNQINCSIHPHEKADEISRTPY